MKKYRDTSKRVDTSKAGGRPRKAKCDRRSHHHKVSYNDEEEAIIQMKAEEYNARDDQYLHDIGICGEVHAHLTEESTEQLRVICGMANNTNQIAHSANAAGFISVRDMALRLLPDLQELIRRILRGGNLAEPVGNNEEY